jgi:acyl carrier protein
MAAAPSVERIQRLFRETLSIDVPAPDADLIELGLIDSLALVELLFAIEREFSVSLPLEELEIDAFRTVTSIGALVAAAEGHSDMVRTVG